LQVLLRQETRVYGLKPVNVGELQLVAVFAAHFHFWVMLNLQQIRILTQF